LCPENCCQVRASSVVFAKKLKGLCGDIKARHARHRFFPGLPGNDMPYLASSNDNTRTPRQQAKEELHVNALRTPMAEEEKVLSLREVLFGALYQLQGQLNLVAAAQDTLRRRNGDYPHDALIEALPQILDSGQASLATLKNCIPQIDTESRGPVNLNQILHEALSLLTADLRENAIVVRWHPFPEPPLDGLENRLRLMFKQLIENAIDAMKHGDSRRRELRFYTCSDGAWIHVCIEDTGPGVPAHLRIKVFEPFFSTKTGMTQRHAGMGLTWIQEVVNQHGGFIQIDPEYVQGCRIHIEFPIFQQQADSVSFVG
jgi:nitrogen fixation negative regulator NifL